jgi:spore germination protein (amino acid permease)
MNDTDRISARQVCTLLAGEILGVGFAVVPKLAVTLAWRDGFIAIIAASIIAAVWTRLAIFAVSRYGGKDYFDACAEGFGKKSAAVLRCGFIIKTVLFMGFCLRILAHTVTETMEGQTSYFAVMLAAALCALYSSAKGREVRGRLSELLLAPMLCVLLVVLVCGIKDGRCDELLPMLNESGLVISRAVLGILLWFYPVEYVLLSLPYISSKRALGKKCALAVLISGGIMALIFALVIMRFGAAQMHSLANPVLEMMYSVNLPSSFIERQEGLMLGVLVVGMFFVISAGIHHSGMCIQQLFKGTSRGVVSLICAVFAVIVGLIPSGFDAAFGGMVNVVLFSEIIYLVVVPVLLWVAYISEGMKK